MSPKEKVRDKYLKRVYGISLKQYLQLLKHQKEACGVCKKPALSFKKSLAVDHNHATGQIRGLLCYTCNHRVIGRHKDPALFYDAYKYLAQPGTKWFVPKKRKKRKRK